MTSERKIAANRRNARKSRGPRGAAGKSIASRNALRHGLAAITHHRSVSASEIEGFAKAICGDDADPSLFAQALVIADNELVLRAIAAQKVAVVERLRERSAIALAKGDNSLALAKARFLKCQQGYDELVALREQAPREIQGQVAAADPVQGNQRVPSGNRAAYSAPSENFFG